MLVELLVVPLEQLALQVVLRQARRHDDHLGEHFTGIVDALGKDASEHRQQEVGVPAAEGPQDLALLAVAGPRLLRDDRVGHRRQPVVDRAEEGVAREKGEDVAPGVGEAGDPARDAVVVGGSAAVGGVDVADRHHEAVLLRKRRRQVELVGAVGVEAEQVAVELEGLEGRRHGDRGGAAVEDLADEARRIAAEDLESVAPGAVAGGDVDELVAAEREHAVEPGEREEDLEHRVVREPHLVLALVHEVAEDGAVEGDPEVRDELEPQLGRALVVPFVAEARGDPAADLGCELRHELGELDEDGLRASFQELERALEQGAGQLRRVVLAAAVDQVVRLVDHQHRVAQGVPVDQGSEADGGIEDVVVVADHDVDLGQEVEADLEGAHRVLLGGREKGIGVLVLRAVEQVGDQARAHQLEAVLAGVGAELLVADDLGVGAHLRLGAQLQAAEETLLHGAHGVDGDALLEGLGGDEVDPLPASERRAHRGVEHRRGLAAAGRRAQEEVALVGERVCHCGADRLLDGAHDRVRKGDAGGGLAEPLEACDPALLVCDQPVELLAQPGPHRIRFPRHLLVTLLLGDDVDQDQPHCRRPLGRREHQGVKGRLPAEPLQPLLGVQVVEVDREVQALDLVDPNRLAVCEHHAVRAPRDLRPPAVDLELELDRDLALIPGLGHLELGLQPPVELGADPQTRHAAAAEADGALRGLADEVADAGADRLPFEVDEDCHVCRRRRWTRWTRRMATARVAAIA